MSAPLPAFQQFQMAFVRRCRNPRSACPKGVPSRNMAVYEESVFSNMTRFLDACFPVCHGVIGTVRWRRLNRVFFRDWRSMTPIFREIPREFVHFLRQTKQAVPAWFYDLAHYEWVELAVDACAARCPAYDSTGDVMQGIPVLNPTLMNLRYAWPVHCISPESRPRRARTTYLLAFRDAQDWVRFKEVNAITAQLIHALSTTKDTGANLIERFADALPEAFARAVRQHGASILHDLRLQGAILGVRV